MVKPKIADNPIVHDNILGEFLVDNNRKSMNFSKFIYYYGIIGSNNI